MIKKTVIQKLKWLDIKEQIICEDKVITWRIFGIPVRRYVLNVIHTLPEKSNTGMGFK